MTTYKKRKEDQPMAKLINLGKYAGAIITIGALFAMIGSSQWAEKKQVNKLELKVKGISVDILWQNKSLTRIEKAIAKMGK